MEIILKVGIAMNILAGLIFAYREEYIKAIWMTQISIFLGIVLVYLQGV